MTNANTTPDADPASQWNDYEDVLNATFFAYLPYESTASQISTFGHKVIPGLLQTRAYATALIHAFTKPETPAETTARRVEARMRRQSIFERPDPPHGHFILDEAALWWGRDKYFDPAMMDTQLHRLRELATRPTVTIEYIPWRHDLTQAMLLAPFNLLEHPEPGHRTVYLERENSTGGSSLVREPERVREYADAFEQLAEMAVSIHEFSYTPPAPRKADPGE